MFWLGLILGMLITFAAFAVALIIIKHRVKKRALAMFGSFKF